MQEMVELAGNEISINGEIKPGSNIRLRGANIHEGEMALSKGTIINPAGIGYLASLGISEMQVFRKPKAGVIVSGNELVKSGQALQAGQIYEGNSIMLASALQSTGFGLEQLKVVKDDFNETVEAIQEMMAQCDVIMLSGSISVGDYDFAGKALESLNVETIFYKVNQKPGKPLFFGKKSNHLFFGLPGNPAASLACYYEYVLPALRKMSGINPVYLEKKLLPAKNGFAKSDERAHFLRARISGNTVVILEKQDSAALQSFALANALVYLPANKNEIEAGERVEVHRLP